LQLRKHCYGKDYLMCNRILTIAILTSLAFAQPTQADAFDSRSRAFNPSDLMDHSLDDKMVNIAENPDRGERALELIIKDIERTDGKFEPRLYGYLSELGQIKQSNQQHLDAIDIFERMQTLTHWADGVYSPLQMESLRLQSRSHTALGKTRNADRIERFHLRVAEQSFDKETDLIFPLWRLAGWQLSSLQYRTALENYERALDIISTHEMDIAYRARTLHAKALTEHLAKKCCSDSTLLTAMSLNKQPLKFDDQQARNVILNAADMAVIRGRSDAMTLYRRLGGAPAALLGPRSKDQIFLLLDRTKGMASDFASKKVINFKQQPTISFGKTPEVVSQFSTGDPVRLCASEVQSESFVEVSVNVSPEGEPSNVKISGDAPNNLKRYLKHTLAKSAYRPEIKNGEALASILTFRQYFDRTRPLQSAKVADWRGILTEHACQFAAMR
jgi:tetratricopeptide (TPR) repeat protein